jgi:hypothetical protein
VARARRRLGRGTLRFTALLLAATAVAGAIRQLWSALWRERPAAATSPLRERAEMHRGVPRTPSAARPAALPAPRPALAEVVPDREQRAVRAAVAPAEPHADFELAGEAGALESGEVAPPGRLEIRR